jgi:hypothetical protein
MPVIHRLSACDPSDADASAEWNSGLRIRMVGVVTATGILIQLRGLRFRRPRNAARHTVTGTRLAPQFVNNWLDRGLRPAFFLLGSLFHQNTSFRLDSTRVHAGQHGRPPVIH